jgi:hypothetical protein
MLVVELSADVQLPVERMLQLLLRAPYPLRYVIHIGWTVIIYTLLLAGLDEAGRAWHPFAGFAVILFGIAICVFFLGSLFIRLSFRGFPYAGALVSQITRESDPRLFWARVTVTVATLPYFVILFSSMCRYWYLDFGGFSAASSDYWYWVRFGASWLLNNYTFGVPQVFNWNISDISATAVGPRLLVVAYNLILDLIVVANVVQIFRERLLPRTVYD